MPLDESSSELCHALARAFCVVGGWESVINNAKLLDIDVALSRCAAFANISDSERHTILKDAAAVIKREGMEGMGNAMEVVGSQHGREMLEVMLQLLMTWETCLPDKKQLMWHLNTDVGVTMDEYYAMWQRIANAPRKTFANSQQK